MAQTQMQIQRDERSLGELFSELATETGTLVRQEVALAQAEVTAKATSVGKNVGFLAIGGAVGYAAVLAILAGVILGLSYLMPAWAAALLVGAVVGIVAFVLIQLALAELKENKSHARRDGRVVKGGCTMAEKTGELKSMDKLDPVSTAAGASGDVSFERYSASDKRDLGNEHR